MTAAGPEIAHRSRFQIADRSARGFVWLVLFICCVMPLAWLAFQCIVHPHIWREAVPDAFRWKLIARTFGYSVLASALATLLGGVVAIALGTGGRASRALWYLLPIPLLMPSLVITYGWSMFLERVGLDPIPQSAGDVARCIVAIASWLWPIAAMLIGDAIRRLDPNLILHARLDGAHLRITARLLLPTVLIAWLLTLLLSLQEFAVFERTGVSVISTEVRSIFETGASLDRSWSMEAVAQDADEPPPPQSARMAAALAVMMPMLIGTAALVLVCAVVARRLRDVGESIDPSLNVMPRSRITTSLGWIVALMLITIPIATMIFTLREPFRLGRVLTEFYPQLRGSTLLALATAGIASAVAVIVSIRGVSRLMIATAIALFLIGGQWIAIALITIFNRPWTLLLYDSSAMPIIAYLCRFLWIALIAARMTWSPAMRGVRELAATDGADRFATWRFIILPLTWPILLGGAMLTFTLSLTEVPATTLLQPTQTLVPMLMTWAHMLNYPAMIRASLLLVAVVMASGVMMTVLVRRGVNR